MGRHYQHQLDETRLNRYNDKITEPYRIEIANLKIRVKQLELLIKSLHATGRGTPEEMIEDIKESIKNLRNAANYNNYDAAKGEAAAKRLIDNLKEKAKDDGLFMNDNKYKALEYMGLYLKEKQWEVNDYNNLVLFLWQDPITSYHHRLDVAFMIQLKREETKMFMEKGYL